MRVVTFTFVPPDRSGRCLTHWVSPDWPAIMAIALGVEGVSSVAKILSKIVKWLAHFQKNGIVSQSMCDITRRANCVPLALFAVPPLGKTVVLVVGELVHLWRAVYYV